MVCHLTELVPAPEGSGALDERLDEREARGFETDLDCLLQLLHVVRGPAGDIVGSRSRCQFAEIERSLGAPEGGCGREAAFRGCRAALTTGHTVDLVVHADDREVNVAPAGMDEVVAADGSHVTVAGKDDHIQVWVCHLDTGGKGNRTPYEQLARKLAVANRIRFAGTSNDMTAIYNAADLLVHPAIYEPFGLVCAEALACGLPVVTTLVTGAAELITPGINGNIVDDPSDSAALAAAIQPFLNRHNVAETALAARRAAESVEFSSTLEQTLTLLEQFLSANHSAPNPAGD